MKIEFVESVEDELVHLKLQKLDPAVIKLIHTLQNRERYIMGSKGEASHKIFIEDIYYFEAVEKRVFFYVEKDVYEVKDKLYQLEERFSEGDFIRVSKSVIVNIEKIDMIYPTISGRFEAKLYNNERISISRNYVSDLKKKLGMEGMR